MTECETKSRLRRISKELMQLANENGGNTQALEAILIADSALVAFLRPTGLGITEGAMQ